MQEENRFEKNRVGLWANAVAAVAMSLYAVSSQGALQLTLSEPGYAPEVIADATNSGAVSFIGPYGTYSANFVIGYSDKEAPTSIADIQIQSLDITQNSSAGVGKTLTILISDDGFTFPGAVGASLLMTSSLGGTLTNAAAGDTVNFSSTAAPAGGASVSTDLQSYTSSMTVAGTESFVVPTASLSFTQTGSYDLSNSINVTLFKPGDTANLSGSTTVSSVPEPSSWGLAIMALGAAIRRQRKEASRRTKWVFKAAGK